MTKEEEYRFDHERSVGETKVGFFKMQQGDNAEALEHFKEALIAMPYNESAKTGMRLALKARYRVYRWFWNYSMWIENQSTSTKWLILFGFYFVYRLLVFVRKAYPQSEIITMPLIILYAIFIFSTWTLEPLSDLMLRLNPYGRFALMPEQVRRSNLLGVTLLLAGCSGMTYIIGSNELFLMLAFFLLSLCIPLSTLFLTPAYSTWRRLFVLYTITMSALGLLAMITFLSNGVVVNGFSMAYLLAFLVYTWGANAVLMR